METWRWRQRGNATDLQVVPVAHFQQLLPVGQRRLPEQERQILAVDPQRVLASWRGSLIGRGLPRGPRCLIGRGLLWGPRCPIGRGLLQAARWRRL